jgi:hypothetical protein
MAHTRYWQRALLVVVGATAGCSAEASSALRGESQAESRVETASGIAYRGSEYGGSEYGGEDPNFGNVYLDTDGMSNLISDSWPYTPGCVYEYVAAGCSGDNLVVRHDYCDGAGKLHEAYVLRGVLTPVGIPDAPPRFSWHFCDANRCCEKHDESVVDCDQICRLQDFTGGGCISVEGDCGHGYCSCVI